MTSPKFRIETNTGVIIVSDLLDYEETIMYTMTVTATDLSNTVPRDARISGADIVWYFCPETIDKPIDKPIDRKDKCWECRYCHYRESNKLSTIPQSVTVTINIEDENDNDPTCDPSVYTNSLSENDAVSTVAANLLCSDADSGDNSLLVYDIISSTDPNADFTVTATGVVETAKTLDFETTQAYSLHVEVSDSGTSGARTTTVQVGVAITPYNEAAPTFTAGLYSTTVSEYSSPGYDVMDIDCTDSDLGDDATMENIEYTLLTSTDYFSIDIESGLVEVKSSLDREATPSALEFIVQCKDTLTVPQQRSSTTTMTITVSDENDNTPVYDPVTYEYEVRENTPVNTVIGQLLVTDEDDPANTVITFTIVGSGNSDAVFAVDTNGEIRVNSVTNLNFEVTKHYTFLVRVQDGGSSPLSATATVEVDILPYNEHTPSFTDDGSYNFRIDEDAALALDVGQVIATDSDDSDYEDGRIVYSIIDGNDEDRFYIDSTSGWIKVKQSVDRESTDYYRLTIRGIDEGTIPHALYSDAIVDIYIDDVNDNVPFCDPTIYATQLYENVGSSVTVAIVLCSDEDDGVNEQLNYAITSGDNPSTNRFSISPSGIITTAISSPFDYEDTKEWDLVVQESLNRELYPSYSLEIYCIDSAGVSSLTATDIVIVTIDDYNDNEPYINPNIFAEEVYENVGDGSTLITNVYSYTTDSDIGVNAMFNFELDVSSNTNADFSIDASSGEITMPGGLDIETTEYYSLVVYVNDLGTPSLTSTATINIRVIQVNEFTPVWQSALYVRYVREDSDHGYSFLQVVATDDDAYEDGEIVYSLVSGSDNGLQKFHIDALSGDVEVKAALDREVYDEYTLTARATDQATTPVGPKYADVTITVYVEDANDNYPIFTPTVYNAEWLEDTQIGTTLVTLACSDNDLGVNSDLSYQITAGNDEGKFTLESTGSGVRILLQQILDIENTAQYTLTVTAYDSGVDGVGNSLALSGDAMVTINVLPVNEYTPYFNPASYSTINVEERTTIDTVVGQVFAADGDIGDYHAFLRFSIASGNEENKWAIDEVTGEIRIAASLDRETTDTYNLVIQVSDNIEGASVIFTNTVDYNILVDDNNDNPPVFTPQTYSIDVLEGALPETAIVTLTTTDADLTANSVHTFTIESGNIDNVFRLDNNILKIDKKLDHEVLDLYKLTIRAHNLGDASSELTADATVTVNVLSENEYTPKFDHETFTVFISEDVILGTKVFDANATDLDKGRHGVLSYYVIDGNEYGGSQFLCNRYTGMVRVGAFLDRERNDTHYLNITVMDDGINENDTFVDFMLLTVVIEDVNDNYPLFPSDLNEIYVDENVPSGYHFFTVQATDADIDENSEISYAIVGGDGWAAFSIDPPSGKIRTAISTLDRERKERYYLMITATDGGTPALSTLKGLIVWVNDLNDNDPMFTPNVYVVNVRENLPNDTVIYQVRASDADIDNNALLSFAIINGDDIPSKFAINDDGEVSLVVSPDREDQETYILTLEVSDNGTVTRTDTASFTVNFIDENDNAPVFSSDPYHIDIEESVAIGTTILHVQSTDADKDINRLISYRIVSGNQAGSFRIDQALGYVITDKLLDRESIATYNITIEAYDAGYEPQSTNVTLYINLIDVNDNFAQFDSYNYTFTVYEDILVGGYIGNISAFDVDNGTNSQLRYTIVSGDYGHFTLHDVTGYLYAGDGFDRELISQYILVIKVIDLGQKIMMQNTVVTRVILEDVNDNNPVYTQSEYAIDIDENLETGTSVLTVVATDIDINENSLLNYAIDTDDTLGLDHFQIDASTGEITINEPTDREANEIIEFHVIASDNGVPVLTSTTLVVVTNLDLNDNKPIFDPSYYVARIPNDYGKTDVLLVVVATDADLDTNAEFQFSLVEYTDVFQMDIFTGELTYLTTASLLLDTYKTHVIARDSGEPSLTSDLATIRVDTFDKEGYSVDIQFGTSCSTFESLKAEFISQTSSLFSPGFIGVWDTRCLTRTATTSLRRRLLVTEDYTIISIYGMRTQETETIDGIDSEADFLTREEILRVLSAEAQGGDPSNVLLTTAFDIFEIEQINPTIPYPEDPTPWYTEWWGILTICLAALIIIILMCLIIIVCIKRQGQKKEHRLPANHPRYNEPQAWVTTRQLEKSKNQPPKKTDVSYIKNTKANANNPLLLPRPTNTARKAAFEPRTNVKKINTPREAEKNAVKTPRRHIRSSQLETLAHGEPIENDVLFDGKAVDPVTGRMYVYNTKTGVKRWADNSNINKTYSREGNLNNTRHSTSHGYPRTVNDAWSF
uniref:Protocadherin Fat 4-like n=1 Tax=Saccoglossus kowalevskii TaxID=10224 RepID=A0ABM0MCS3_SACKO|nr:PREDICTED: protocadherin Fat 4-like [Saccoglossus kowalevskii]